ncbi:MAG: hypothetical protein AB8B53_14835 [Flavobacteriales bacterium]
MTNGDFRLLLYGITEARLKNMLFYDVNNGIARRSWARNEETVYPIKREMEHTPKLIITLVHIGDDSVSE